MIPWYPIGQYRTIPLDPMPTPAAVHSNYPPAPTKDNVYVRLFKLAPQPMKKVEELVAAEKVFPWRH